MTPPWWRRFSLVLSLCSWCSSLSTARSSAVNASGAATLHRTAWPWPCIETSQTSLRSARRGFASSEKCTSARSMPSRYLSSLPIFSRVTSSSLGVITVFRLLMATCMRGLLSGHGRWQPSLRMCDGSRAGPTGCPGSAGHDHGVHRERAPASPQDARPPRPASRPSWRRRRRAGSTPATSAGPRTRARRCRLRRAEPGLGATPVAPQQRPHRPPASAAPRPGPAARPGRSRGARRGRATWAPTSRRRSCRPCTRAASCPPSHGTASRRLRYLSASSSDRTAPSYANSAPNESSPATGATPRRGAAPPGTPSHGAAPAASHSGHAAGSTWPSTLRTRYDSDPATLFWLAFPPREGHEKRARGG